MEDVIVSNLASKALELLGKEAIQKAAPWWGAREDLQKLMDSISKIQARVRDAERRQEDSSGEAIKEWLRRLRQVLYRTEDLFDEVLTLDLKQQQRMEQSTLGKVGILFSKSGPLYYNTRLAKEIKSIRKQLDAIKSNMAVLNSNVGVPYELRYPTTNLMKQRETSSVVNTEAVIGRENDQNMIISMLFDPKYDGDEITVIPIVGFGGLGKTTLAQLVFNDERVKKQFDLTGWACVPEIDNVIVIMGKILKSFTGRNYDNLSLEQIEFHIIQSIKTKKYLLVLDDLSEEQADRLKRLVDVLKFGKQGSKVVVTTRSDLVAKVVGTIEVSHKLGTLTDDQSWNLFKNIAFAPGQEDSNPRLCSIGKEIVQMCGNMPLAIKVVGSQLRSRHTEEEWLQVRDAHRPTTQRSNLDDVMPVLKLSYDCLSPESKLCFAYCSLFPKGYEFKENDLVHLWMAQGYVHQDNGYQLFGDLVARNFFQVSNEGDGLYKMHDLLHDLAQDVAGDESMMVGRDESPGQICDRLVHINLNRLKCPSSLKNANRLRSLLNYNSTADDEKLLSKFQSLRVLSMDGFLNDEKLLSNSVGRLIHLRYLKLETYGVKFLPGSITRLVNLQTLNLELCYLLMELPRDFARLVNLRHLLLPFNLAVLPPGFGKLTSLQELNVFKVGKGNGIDSLPALNLKGNLIINFREWRRDAIEEVKRANLKNNHQLTSLTLHLEEEQEESTAAAAGEMNDMLRHLQLPPNLKHLMVCFYKGDEMPIRWFDGLSQLVSVEISGCRNCKVLPNLSGLPHLKFLVLSFLQDLEYVEDEDNIRVGTAIDNRCFFRSLEVLHIYWCYKLKGWTRVSNDDIERCQLVFPCLLKMKVESCPMLMSMPLAPMLESLDVCGIKWKMFESNVRSNDDEEAASSSSTPSSLTLFTSLKELEIESVNDELISLSISSSLCNLSKLRIDECSQLTRLRFEFPNSIRELKIKWCRRLKNISEGLQHLCRLEELEIEDCEELEMEEEEEQEEGKSFSVWQGLSSLRELRLERIPKVKTLPRGIACITTLQHLKVWHMENLTEIPEEIGNLSQLRQLWIMKCPKLKSLPSSILCLARLQELKLWNIENLTELPSEIGNGNLPLLSRLEIKHCPKVKSLPSSIQNLASLRTLIIAGRPNLVKNNVLGGKDRHLIQHLPNLYIDGFGRRQREDDGKKGNIGHGIPFDIITDVSKVVDKSMESQSQPPSNKCSQLWATPLLVLKAILKLRANVMKKYTTVLVERMVPSTESESCRQLLAKFPNHLKMMLHCLLFPKDYKFGKERLIHLWSAAGLLKSEPVEDDGESFFHFLLEKRFIIAPTNDDFSGTEIYKFNSMEFGSFFDKLGAVQHFDRRTKSANMIANRFANYWDVSVTSGDIDQETFELLGNFSKLRSLLFLNGSVVTTVPSHIFSALKFLRTLDLSCTGIKELPSSIHCAKELRYLDLSWTLIERLPYSIGDLCELQALKLKGCVHLFSLPKRMNRLTKLRHLDFDILGQLTSMPEGIGALVELQTLLAFIVGNEDGCNIKELKNMNHLSGELCLSGLENVMEVEAAREAALINKRHLSQLELRWSSIAEKIHGCNYVEVLEGLEPNTCLKDLQIICFPGTKFPKWVGEHSYSNLVSIMLYKCEDCEHLPSLGGLPNLRKLKIIEMNGVRVIEDNIPFPKLQTLTIDGMDCLEKWSGLNGFTFPSVDNLIIKNCPRWSKDLTSLSCLQSLLQLEIVNCPMLQSLPEELLSPSLQTLIIEDCPFGNSFEKGGEDRNKIPKEAKVWIFPDSQKSDEDIEEDDVSTLGDMENGVQNRLPYN